MLRKHESVAESNLLRRKEIIIIKKIRHSFELKVDDMMGETWSLFFQFTKQKSVSLKLPSPTASPSVGIVESLCVVA